LDCAKDDMEIFGIYQEDAQCRRVNGEGKLRGQLGNPGSPDKWLLKWRYVLLTFCYQYIK